MSRGTVALGSLMALLALAACQQSQNVQVGTRQAYLLAGDSLTYHRDRLLNRYAQDRGTTAAVIWSQWNQSQKWEFLMWTDLLGKRLPIYGGYSGSMLEQVTKLAQ